MIDGIPLTVLLLLTAWAGAGLAVNALTLMLAVRNGHAAWSFVFLCGILVSLTLLGKLIFLTS